MRHAKLGQRLDYGAEVGFLLRRVEARHLQNAAARQMNAADVRRLKAHVVLLTACNPREPVVDAEHIPTVPRRLTDYGRDDTVDAGCGAATADNRNHILDANHETFLLIGLE